jgi:hypothetical protein
LQKSRVVQRNKSWQAGRGIAISQHFETFVEGFHRFRHKGLPAAGAAALTTAHDLFPFPIHNQGGFECIRKERRTITMPVIISP